MQFDWHIFTRHPWLTGGGLAIAVVGAYLLSRGGSSGASANAASAPTAAEIAATASTQQMQIQANAAAAHDQLQFQLGEDTLHQQGDIATLSAATQLKALEDQLGAQTTQATIQAGVSTHQMDVQSGTQVQLAGIAAKTAQDQIASLAGIVTAQEQTRQQAQQDAFALQSQQIDFMRSIAPSVIETQQQKQQQDYNIAYNNKGPYQVAQPQTDWASIIKAASPLALAFG